MVAQKTAKHGGAGAVEGKPSASVVTKAKLPVGRPSKNTPELRAEICSRLSKGEPLAVICRDDHMPHDNKVREWANVDEVFSGDIARARVLGFDAIAWEALQIANTPLEGVETTTKADGSKETKTGDMLGHRKLQIETRLKLLAKWDPKRYGDKTILAGDPENPLATNQPVYALTTEALMAIAKNAK